jgi:type I restriction enzyme S subunit
MKQGWEVKKLGDVCELYQPKTISSKEMVDDGNYPVFGANGIIGKYDKYNHEEPQLLITCRGATCGSINISEPKSWINGNAMVVRPKDNSLSLKFIEYLFLGGIDISKTITGAAQPQITRQSLSPVLISYPSSIQEQQRIVAILDEAFAAIAKAKANAEQNLKNAKQLFESYLQGVFDNKGEDWEEKTLEKV